MSLFKSYWTVQGISPDARDAAIRAAEANGEELGVWLSRLINRVSAAESHRVPVSQPRPVNATVNSDEKMSSIERAMIQSRDPGKAETA